MAGILAPSDQYAHPIIDCINATAVLPVIKLVESNVTSITLDGDCVVVKADEYSTKAAKDRLLYALLGVIE